MLSILRKIRRSLFLPGKVRTYMAYAAGEIVLIVVGILLALQISEWNQSRKDRVREEILLNELVSNLQTNVSNLKGDIGYQIKSTETIRFLLNHLDNELPYEESLNSKFFESDFVTDVILASSAFETLKSIGLELIKSDLLRKEIIDLFEVTYPYLLAETVRLENQTWPAVVVPMFQKHFRKDNPKSYVPIDYDALLEDKEFTNMLSFRMTLRAYSTEQKQDAVKKTQEVINLIQTEMGQ